MVTISLLGAALVLALVSDARDSAAAPEPSRWGAEYFPNVELVTHEGRTVRFFDDLLRDKVVVINFMYTSCPDACPLETARLAEVQDILGARVGADVFLYSISIDPARDSVAALASYAERFQVKPGWLFLRGAEEDVLLLRRKLGVLGEGETELQDHSLSLVLGNQATGRWMRRSPFENAHVLADEIGTWLHNWKLAPRAGGDYAEAPELRRLTRGESLFRTRCSACHEIGPGDGLARVGPNLLGVTAARDPLWLARWIREPDAMLAEGDPLATSLFEAWRRVPMPNMRLNELEVAALLEFLESESARHAAPAPSAVPAAAPAADAARKGCCVKDEVGVLGRAPDTAAVGSGPQPAAIAAAVSAAPASTPPAPRSFAAGWMLSLGLAAGLGLLAGCCGRPAR